ncbi:MAG: hypothetical protein HZA01_02845 [Nitrospinae bacterium]|nr:hypothetical protein [Nitrospinota bacterium]
MARRSKYSPSLDRGTPRNGMAKPGLAPDDSHSPSKPSLLSPASRWGGGWGRVTSVNAGSGAASG